MWLKICGITRSEDAIRAEEYGADAIGFVFADSPRQIDVATAANISRNIRIPRVGVFVNAELREILEIRKQCGLDIIQLHGDESPGFCDALGGTIIKAFRVKNKESLAKMDSYTKIWKILLDAYVPGQSGGTGKRIDSRLLAKMDLSNIILAGGIRPDNINSILQKYAPFGLDVSSGLEGSPGVKNIKKMKNLINTVKKRG